jgi:Beta-propeller repeat
MPLLSLRPTAHLALAVLLALGLFVGGMPAPVTAQSTPALAYGTFLGGASDDVANAVATDAQGNIYVAGYTYSNPFPGTAGAGPYTNAFVMKLDPTGTQVLYSTLMGGSNDEEALALAVDAQGNAWVTGFTESNDLPLIRALRENLLGERDTFLTKLAPNGDVFFQTYLGWPGSDQANAIALDPQGNAYLAGEMAAEFGPQVRVAKVKADGSTDLYDVTFGRATRGFAKGSKASAIAVDTLGNAYLVGKTNTGAFDTGGFQDRCVGFANEIDDCPSDDAFVVVLNAAGDGLIGGTMLGGLQNDEATGVALDRDNNIYVTGTTFSDDFPTKAAWQAQRQGTGSFADSFLVKLAPLATELVYGTYYGGDSFDEAHGIAVDGAGRAYLTGLTSSGDLPVLAAFQPTISGQCITGETRRLCFDAYVASFDAAGSLSWASFIGGTDDDLGKSVTIGPSGDVYLVGRADSLSLPTTQDALQPQRRGFDDAFLMRVSSRGATAPPVSAYSIFVPLVRR